MEIELVMERVAERDIDLYIINKFINDIKFKELFLEKLHKKGYKIEKCIHSYRDEDGESDITIILKSSINKIALLIEDKIDAISMPNQRKRYDYRGNRGIKEGKYDEYFVFIIAPKEYLANNTEAQKYENQISYEEIIDYLGNMDRYGSLLLKKAIEEKKKGYVIKEDKKVTKFWEKYYDYVETNYKELSIKRYDGTRGTDAWWPGFATPVKYIRINHKANRGDIDLTFPKSVSIRLKAPIIRFDGEFEDYLNEMKESMDAVVRLQKLLSRIDYKKIINLINAEDNVSEVK